MRTNAKHQAAWTKMTEYHGTNGKSVWLIPTVDDYSISADKPSSDSLPHGTSAILYAVGGTIEGEVKSSQSWSDTPADDSEPTIVEGRTEKKFKVARQRMLDYHTMHKKPVWLIPTETDYAISVVPPNANELPFGTAAILYGVGETIDDEIRSSKTLF